MPAIPVNAAVNPCAQHACSQCCYETEMPLTEGDIKRLVALGHARESFVEDEEGFPVLKNRPATPPDEGHHCVFLADGECSVYADRPIGCQWYPIVITPERRAVKDEDCPHRGEFRMKPSATRELTKLLSLMERERKARKRAAKAR